MTDELFETIKTLSAGSAAPHIAAGLRRRAERAEDLLEQYLIAYPAFRAKPVGAPGSAVRADQDALIALEDRARAALGEATSK